MTFLQPISAIFRRAESSPHPARVARNPRPGISVPWLGLCLALVGFHASAASRNDDDSGRFVPLFASEGVPAGWNVRSWNNVAHPAPPSARWIVEEGVLRGSQPRGTWLVSPVDYGDFVLEFEFRLGERGQGGVGLRFPQQGDPSTEGLVVQMVDPNYFPPQSTPRPREKTGALYGAVAPTRDTYRPLEWNRYIIRCQGSRVTVTLNDKKVVDVDLTKEIDADEPVRGKPLAERPTRGRIGFLEASRGSARVEIRNARIRSLR